MDEVIFAFFLALGVTCSACYSMKGFRQNNLRTPYTPLCEDDEEFFSLANLPLRCVKRPPKGLFAGLANLPIFALPVNNCSHVH